MTQSHCVIYLISIIYSMGKFRIHAQQQGAATGLVCTIAAHRGVGTGILSLGSGFAWLPRGVERQGAGGRHV